MKQEVPGKYSFGVGDRFAQQAAAQIAAIQVAEKHGISLTPVWNKSYREHSITGTEPVETREAVDAAIEKTKWNKSYFIDADHINLDTVDRFMDCSNYFTIDVAEFIGRAAPDEEIGQFVDANKKYRGEIVVHPSAHTFRITEEMLARVAAKYLVAAKEAGKIYRHIRRMKKEETFVIEVSMDEAESPQSPPELFFILAALSSEQIPIRAIAPKFSGRFNKGIDYVGDVDRFRREFEELLATIRFAVAEFGLPEDLKISVHTGSDKFSIYPVIKNAVRKFDAGIHIKTAGTTWLEELAGLAEADRRGLALAKEVYSKSYAKLDELCADYTAVIDIDPGKLPTVATVDGWDGREFVKALRHEPGCPDYNPHFRQLLHVGFKIAAGMGEEFLSEVRRHERIISKNVTENLFTRHIKRLFLE